MSASRMSRLAAAIFVLLALGACESLKKPLAFLVPDRHASSNEPHFRAQDVRPARWALVLSSGAMRGFAHVGVVRELEAAGLRPDLIVGTSAGAMVGALAASGAPASRVEEAALDLRSRVFMLGTLPYTGVMEGRRIDEFVHTQAMQHNIEDFPIRFAAVATEAERGCLQIFTAGDAGRAVQASSTVPVLLSPPAISGKRYLDGGLVSPLPVRVARMLGAERVVAVDVIFDPAERPFLNITDAFWRSTLVMHRTLAAIEGAEADLLLVPRLPAESDISFGNRPALFEAGAQSVREALPALRRLIAEPPSKHWASIPPLLCKDR